MIGGHTKNRLHYYRQSVVDYRISIVGVRLSAVGHRLSVVRMSANGCVL